VPSQTSVKKANELAKKEVKREGNQSERGEYYKARTSQSQSQNPSAPVRRSRVHGIGQNVEY
jgi:hypothetical protein